VVFFIALHFSIKVFFFFFLFRLDHAKHKSLVIVQILAEIELDPAHRLICFQMAIADNMAAENFGLVARLIEVKSI
jgi:hypothetical protein